MGSSVSAAAEELQRAEVGDPITTLPLRQPNRKNKGNHPSVIGVGAPGRMSELWEAET